MSRQLGSAPYRDTFSASNLVRPLRSSFLLAGGFEEAEVAVLLTTKKKKLSVPRNIVVPLFVAGCDLLHTSVTFFCIAYFCMHSFPQLPHIDSEAFRGD